MDNAVRTLIYKGYEINICTDDSPENPITEWDILGKFICWHRRYDLGNCQDFETPEEVREYAARTGSMLFPLFMYDHSGICLSLSNSRYPFNDRWDAGQLGYVLVDRQKALEKLGKKRMSKKLRRRITQIIEAEVDTYNSYLSGDVYGYVVEKDGEQIDSCWGFYHLHFGRLFLEARQIYTPIYNNNRISASISEIIHPQNIYLIQFQYQ